MQKILLVEDSTEYIQLVQKILGTKYHIRVAPNLSAAREEISRGTFDLILLDVVLPDGQGFDFCSEVRSANLSTAPIIFLSGRGEVQDRVMGWSLGAEDYITKPFSIAEFQVRIQNRLDRQKSKSEASNTLSVGGLTVDLAFHEATIHEGNSARKLDLTPIEFKILYYLMKNADRVLTRTQVIDTAWGNSVHITERTVDKHISTLRHKLNSEEVMIKTISGLGYKMIRSSAA
jgi:two-component system phosphate regulon response regulator PhoB